MNSDFGKNFKNSTAIIIIAMSFVFSFAILIMFVCPHLMFYRFFFSPAVFFNLPHFCLLANIITNFIGKKSIMDCPACIVLNAIFICYLPYSKYGPTQWVPDYDFWQGFKFLLLQSGLALILTAQYFMGPRLNSKPKKPTSFKYRAPQQEDIEADQSLDEITMKELTDTQSMTKTRKPSKSPNREKSA